MLAEVDGSEFKTLMRNANNILKKTALTKSLGFEVRDSKLIVTVWTTIIYQDTLDIECKGPSSNFSITVINNDIEGLINPRIPVELEIAPYGVIVRQDEIDVKLFPSDAIVQSFEHKEVAKEMLAAQVTSSLKLATNVVILDKSYLRESDIILKGDIMELRYPSFWIRMRSSGLNIELSKNDARILNTFAPTYYYDGDPSYVFFYTEHAFIAIPKRVTEEDGSFMKICNELDTVGKLNIGSLKNKIRDVLKCTGEGNCKLEIMESGIRLNMQKPDIAVSSVVGRVSDVLSIADIPSNFLIALSNLFDGDVEILAGGNKLCIRSTQVSTLIYSN